MTAHDLIQPHFTTPATFGGSAVAMFAGLIAAASATTPEVANGGVYVGVGGILVGVLGVLAKFAQIWADDRRSAREVVQDVRILREQATQLRVELEWFKAHYRPIPVPSESDSAFNETTTVHAAPVAVPAS